MILGTIEYADRWWALWTAKHDDHFGIYSEDLVTPDGQSVRLTISEDFSKPEWPPAQMQRKSRLNQTLYLRISTDVERMEGVCSVAMRNVEAITSTNVFGNILLEIPEHSSTQSIRQLIIRPGITIWLALVADNDHYEVRPSINLSILKNPK